MDIIYTKESRLKMNGLQVINCVTTLIAISIIGGVWIWLNDIIIAHNSLIDELRKRK